MAEIYITSQELIATLNVTSQDLINIETFFDSIPDDEWELIKGKDYRVVNGNGLREYTYSGAYTIARYLETTKKLGFWQLIKEWFTHTQLKIRRSFIRKKILNNCSSLVRRNSQFFISRSDVVAIFGTRSDYLTKMADYTQKTQYALIKGQDYEDFGDKSGLYFSVTGIYKLAQAFAECLTKKNRREECKDVKEVISSQVDDIVNQIMHRDKRIQSAMNKVKQRDHSTCQVTNQKSDRVNRLRLAAHHLYSQNEYPFLADVENNLITVCIDVHDQFHQHYMGGTCNPCTVDDFIGFVEKYYPHNTTIVIWLEQQKLVLGNPQPQDKRKPHVLYLPVSRVI